MSLAVNKFKLMSVKTLNSKNLEAVKLQDVYKFNLLNCKDANSF
jgi:hypothetical protein